MSASPSPVARALLVLLMCAGVLGFGAVGLCGGMFTVSVLSEVFQWRGAGAAMLLLTMPCLLAGGYMVKVCATTLWRTLRGQPLDDEDAPP